MKIRLPMKTQSIHFLYQSAIMSSLIFIPLMAKDLGATDWEIGVIGATYGTALFLSSYLFGRLSDLYDKKPIILLGLAVASLSFALQVCARDVVSLALVRTLAGFSIGIFPPALVACVYESKIRFGNFLSFGSLGWAAGSFVAGLIAVYYKIFVFSSLCFFLAFLIACTLPSIRYKPSMSIPRFPLNLIKKDFAVYLSFFLRHMSANAVWIIFPLFVIELGGNMTWVGLLYTTNYVGQFVCMNLLDRFKSSKLITLGFLCSAITFLGYVFAQNIYQLILIELLLAFSWSSLWTGTNLHLLNGNREHSTVMGLLNSTLSLSVACGPLVGGCIAYLAGYRATMGFAFCFAICALVIFKLGKETEST